MIIRTTLIAMMLAASTQAAVTVTLRPSSTTPNSGDAYTASANASSNFGNAGALAVAGNGAANTKGVFQSVLKFDLATVVSTLNSTFGAGQWTLDSVQLELTSVVPNNTSFNANAAGTVAVDWLTGDAWTETGITWNGMSSLISGGTQSMGSFSYDGGTGTTDYTLSASSGFLNDLQSGSIASLRLYAGTADVSMTMNSRNFGTAANRPALIITASPEPSRAGLMLAGLSLLGWRRNRLNTQST